MEETFNVDRIGPGTWYMLHLVSYYAREKRDIDMLVYSIGTGFVCPICRSHFNEYIRANPIPEKNDDLQIFYYFVELHNDVNARNGKKRMDPLTVYNMYLNPSCDGSCTGTHHDKHVSHSVSKALMGRRS